MLVYLSGLRACRPLLFYAGFTMLFHSANAPLLPLIGRKLTVARNEWAIATGAATLPAKGGLG